MFWKTVAGNQFMQGTLPHIIRTVEQLSTNIGRSAMALEQRNKTVHGIGGTTDYLAQLLDRYGPDATMVRVAIQERERLSKEEYEKVDEEFKNLDSLIEVSKEEGN